MDIAAGTCGSIETQGQGEDSIGSNQPDSRVPSEILAPKLQAYLGILALRFYRDQWKSGEVESLVCQWLCGVCATAETLAGKRTCAPPLPQGHSVISHETGKSMRVHSFQEFNESMAFVDGHTWQHLWIMGQHQFKMQVACPMHQTLCGTVDLFISKVCVFLQSSRADPLQLGWILI